jgi:hypothetical protein
MTTNLDDDESKFKKNEDVNDDLTSTLIKKFTSTKKVLTEDIDDEERTKEIEQNKFVNTIKETLEENKNQSSLSKVGESFASAQEGNRKIAENKVNVVFVKQKVMNQDEEKKSGTVFNNSNFETFVEINYEIEADLEKQPENVELDTGYDILMMDIFEDVKGKEVDDNAHDCEEDLEEEMLILYLENEHNITSSSAVPEEDFIIFDKSLSRLRTSLSSISSVWFYVLNMVEHLTIFMQDILLCWQLITKHTDQATPTNYSPIKTNRYFHIILPLSKILASLYTDLPLFKMHDDLTPPLYLDTGRQCLISGNISHIVTTAS